MRNVTFILGYMDYMWLYGLYVVLWVMWVICGYIYIYVYVFFVFFVCFIHNHFSNIQWFIFKTSIAERNFHLINRSPSFRKCSSWNLPKNSNITDDLLFLLQWCRLAGLVHLFYLLHCLCLWNSGYLATVSQLPPSPHCLHTAQVCLVSLI